MHENATSQIQTHNTYNNTNYNSRRGPCASECLNNNQVSCGGTQGGRGIQSSVLQLSTQQSNWTPTRNFPSFQAYFFSYRLPDGESIFVNSDAQGSSSMRNWEMIIDPMNYFTMRGVDADQVNEFDRNHSQAHLSYKSNYSSSLDRTCCDQSEYSSTSTAVCR